MSLIRRWVRDHDLVMVRAPVSAEQVRTALQQIGRHSSSSGELASAQVRDAVRTTLRWLAQEHAGHTVEIRVPPYAAVQAIAGPRHTRGTPPNVVETDPETWLALVSGTLHWDDAVASGRVRASGLRADLSALLPMIPPPTGL